MSTYWRAEIECLPRANLRELQLQKLQRILKRAYERMPFYREKFDASGMRVDEFRSLEQLPQLPFTYKSDLWEHYPLGMLAVAPEEIVRVHASSGTKGRLTLVAYSKRDIENWAELCARSLIAGGARPGMRLQNAYGYGLFTGGLGFHYGAELLPATVIPTSGGNTMRQLRLLEDLRPEVLCCTPSFALTLADARERSNSAGNLNLRVGFFGAEPWSEAMRGQIEKRLGLVALDTYGLSEMGGPGVAQECAAEKNGLHIWEDHFLAEVINPETGEALPPGQEGELVLTTLEKEALPLIRYRTGDITALEGNRCSCGRTHTRMRKVRGRRDDMLIIRGVNFYPSEVETILFKFPEVLPFYEIVVDRPASLDRLTIRVECAPEIAGNDSSREELAYKIQCAVCDTCGVSAQVSPVLPGTLARSEAKAMRVIDQRPKEV